MQLFALLKHEVHQPEIRFFLTAEREEMISCVYVSREEERVAVAFSRPVNVSELFHDFFEELSFCYSCSLAVTHISLFWVHFWKTKRVTLLTSLRFSTAVNLTDIVCLQMRNTPTFSFFFLFYHNEKNDTTSGNTIYIVHFTTCYRGIDIHLK